MKKHYRWVGTAGVIVLLLPFLGIPYSWKMVLEFIVGLALVGLAIIEKQMFIYTENDSEDKTFEESQHLSDNHFDGTQEQMKIEEVDNSTNVQSDYNFRENSEDRGYGEDNEEDSEEEKENHYRYRGYGEDNEEDSEEEKENHYR